MPNVPAWTEKLRYALTTASGALAAFAAAAIARRSARASERTSPARLTGTRRGGT